VTLYQPQFVPVDSEIGHYGTDLAAEDWIADLAIDLTADTATTVELMLSGVFLASTPDLPYEFRLRKGGGERAADGQEILLLVGQGVTQSQINAGGSGIGQGYTLVDLLPINGPTLLKLTGRSGIAGQAIQMRGGMLRALQSTAEVRKMGISQPLGTDIWFDVLASDGEPNTMVTPAGDWKLVSGRTAVVQSLTRRYLTSPGEWKTLPNYGAGLRAACHRRARQADLDALANAIKHQSMLDDRVKSVGDVLIQRIGANAVKFTVTVILKNDEKPLTFGGEVLPS
jgi:hypothetical protein